VSVCEELSVSSNMEVGREPFSHGLDPCVEVCEQHRRRHEEHPHDEGLGYTEGRHSQLNGSGTAIP
jgi:hypothetical protein